MRLLSMALCVVFVLYVTPAGAEPIGPSPSTPDRTPLRGETDSEVHVTPLWLAWLDDETIEEDAPDRDEEGPPSTGSGEEQLEPEEPPIDAEAIESEIQRLYQERNQLGVGRAIAATATGGALFAAGALTAAAVYSACEDAKDDRHEDCHETRARNLEIGFGALALVGAITATVGGVLLSKRLREQRAIDGQLRSLRNRLSTARRSGISDVVVGVAVMDGGARIGVGMKF